MPSQWRASIERNLRLAQALTERQRLRYWRNVRKTRGCWHWQGRVDYKGYGVLQCGNFGLRAHRVALILSGQMPSNWEHQACHTCLKNPACVNPAHLYWGTARDNVRDSLPGLQARTDKQIAALKFKRKLSAQQVQAIWQAYHSTQETAKAIAMRYGISGTHVQYIGKGAARKAVAQAIAPAGRKKRYALLHEGQVGETHWKAKLTDKQVQVIRKALCSGATVGGLAIRYGVTPSTISFIATGRTRKQLPWPIGCAPRKSHKQKTGKGKAHPGCSAGVHQAKRSGRNQRSPC